MVKAVLTAFCLVADEKGLAETSFIRGENVSFSSKNVTHSICLWFGKTVWPGKE